MSDRDPEPTPTRAGSRGPGRHFVLVPAATFLVGLLLGAVLVWVSRPAGTDGQPTPESPSPSPGATTSAPPVARPTDAIIVPRACVRAAQAAGDVVTAMRDAVRALRELDTVELQRIVDDLERLDRQIRADAARCRPETVSPTPTPTPNPAPTPAPTTSP